MKSNLRNFYGYFLLISLLLMSCREEESEFIDPSPGQTLEINTAIAELLQNTSMNDGSTDNIIDSASCFNIQLPVTVTVNGLEIVVDSREDLQVIEDIIDEFDDDEDFLEIEFPIVIVFGDFTEVLVNSHAEFEDFVDDCGGEDQEDDDIECIDLIYPISASLFNLSNELINTVDISSDRDLYNFIDDLSEDIVVNVLFPITVLLADGSELEVSDLEELEDIIEDAKDTCDEDDDNDFNDDDCNNCTTSQLTDLLLDCPGWRVEKLERNDLKLEDQYDGYSFGFMSDGILTAVNGSNSLEGTWSTDGSANNITVTINIPELDDFNEVWNLHEIEVHNDEQKVDLRLGDDRLRFECD